MTNVRVTSKRTIEGGQLTIGDYRRLFEGLPDEVVVHTHVYAGDRPWDSGSTSVTVDGSAASRADKPSASQGHTDTNTDWNGTWETTR